MSILTETLPEHLVVVGKEYKINTDFKAWLRFSTLISTDITSGKQIALIFKSIFDELPPTMMEALKEAMKFFSHITDEECDVAVGTPQSKERHLDFEYDADLIYSAFMQQYGIDLCDASMHWWKFKALLNGLSEETHFVKVVQFRSMDISKIKDRELKKFYMEMKVRYRLPGELSEAKKERRLGNALSNMF